MQKRKVERVNSGGSKSYERLSYAGGARYTALGGGRKAELGGQNDVLQITEADLKDLKRTQPSKNQNLESTPKIKLRKNL